jgi:hypothetical protein
MQGSVWWVLLLAVSLLLLSSARSFDKKQEPVKTESRVSKLVQPYPAKTRHTSASELADSTKFPVASDSSSSSSSSKDQAQSSGRVQAAQVSKDMPPFLPPKPAKEECPAWIAEYAKFHR